MFWSLAQTLFEDVMLCCDPEFPAMFTDMVKKQLHSLAQASLAFWTALKCTVMSNSELAYTALYKIQTWLHSYVRWLLLNLTMLRVNIYLQFTWYLYIGGISLGNVYALRWRALQKKPNNIAISNGRLWSNLINFWAPLRCNGRVRILCLLLCLDLLCGGKVLKGFTTLKIENQGLDFESTEHLCRTLETRVPMEKLNWRLWLWREFYESIWLVMQSPSKMNICSAVSLHLASYSKAWSVQIQPI